MRIVIIEDEKFTALDLAKTIQLSQEDAEIVATITSVEDGIEFFSSTQQIDLIFSDIQLGDGKSFEIFEKVRIETPIIFCTAFDEYALKAFETTGIDYVLKPFSKETINNALQKYKNIVKSATAQPNDLKALFDIINHKIKPTKLPNILIRQGDKIKPVTGESIALFYIENGIVRALDFNGKKFMVSQTLDELEVMYEPYFFRANRQFFINRTAVKEASQYFNRKLLVILTINFEEQILIGKEKMKSFLDWLINN